MKNNFQCQVKYVVRSSTQILSFIFACTAPFQISASHNDIVTKHLFHYACVYQEIYVVISIMWCMTRLHVHLFSAWT